jgi:hypothetical protein
VGTVRLSALPLAVVAVVVAACGGTTAEDRERLELLKADPLFDYAPPGQTPADATTTNDLLADGDDVIGDMTQTVHSVRFALARDDDHLVIMREVEELMIDQGWQDLEARCLDYEITVFGAKEVDDFIARGGVKLTPNFYLLDVESRPGPGLTVKMSAPYHSREGGEIEGHAPDTDCLHRTDDEP